jgi:hypothetical protein
VYTRVVHAKHLAEAHLFRNLGQGLELGGIGKIFFIEYAIDYNRHFDIY